jgi:hypothetical protein
VDWALRHSVTAQFLVTLCTGLKHGQYGFGIQGDQDRACVNNAPIAPFSTCGIGPGGFAVLCINAYKIVLAGQAEDMAVLENGCVVLNGIVGIGPEFLCLKLIPIF